MNITELIVTMTLIAQEHIKHYFTDFTAYDIPRLVKVSEKIKYTWSIRDSGTWLLAYEDGKVSDVLEIIRSQYEGDPTYKEYTITFDGNEWELTEGVE